MLGGAGFFDHLIVLRPEIGTQFLEGRTPLERLRFGPVLPSPGIPELYKVLPGDSCGGTIFPGD